MIVEAKSHYYNTRQSDANHKDMFQVLEFLLNKKGVVLPISTKTPLNLQSTIFNEKMPVLTLLIATHHSVWQQDRCHAKLAYIKPICNTFLM